MHFASWTFALGIAKRHSVIIKTGIFREWSELFRWNQAERGCQRIPDIEVKNFPTIDETKLNFRIKKRVPARQ